MYYQLLLVNCHVNLEYNVHAVGADKITVSDLPPPTGNSNHVAFLPPVSNLPNNKIKLHILQRKEIS
jgi:hypothetical protein